MHSVAKKVAKRKIDPPVLTKEIKVKKVDSTMKVKKSSSKAELIMQLEELLLKYDALKKENYKNTDLIAKLKKNNSKHESANVSVARETQTDNGLSLKCMECNFESDSKEELQWHMHENHGWSNILFDGSDTAAIEREPGLICKQCKYRAEDIYDYDGHFWSEICTDPTVQKQTEDADSLSCDFCDEKFRKLRKLMKQEKLHHAESIHPCWNHASGKCEYGDEECWFSHSIEMEGMEQTFECNNCDETFDVKAKLLYHRKKHHV